MKTKFGKMRIALIAMVCMFGIFLMSGTAANAATTETFSEEQIKANAEKLSPGMLVTGKEFNVSLKSLNSSTVTNYGTSDSKIKYIVFTKNKPADKTYSKTPKTVGKNVLAYYCEKDSTVYVEYTGRIFFNSDSSYMFSSFKQLRTVDFGKDCIDTSTVTDMNHFFYSSWYLQDMDFSALNTVNVVDMSYMFYNAELKQPVINFNTANVKNMSYMFCSSYLKTLDTINFSDTSKVTDMSHMFEDCSSLTEIDFGKFNTSSAETLVAMFSGCYNAETVSYGPGFNTANVKKFCNLFRKCSKLTTIDLSRFNTSSARSFVGMFEECRSLETLNCSSFNSSNVVTMNKMFYNCRNLNSLNISSFNTAKVEDMQYMFYECCNIDVLDLRSFDVSLAEKTKPKTSSSCGCDTYSAYYGTDGMLDCHVNVLYAPSVISESIQLSNYVALDDNANNVPDSSVRLKKLTAAHAGHRFIAWSGTDLKNDGNYFGDASGVANVQGHGYAENVFEINGITYAIFSDGTAVATKIKSEGKIKINSVTYNNHTYPVSEIAKGAAKGNKKLTSLETGKNVKKIGANAFNGCKKLKKVTITAQKSLKVGKNAFKKLPKTAVIKVKGIKGKSKTKLVKVIMKQTNASVK